MRLYKQKTTGPWWLDVTIDGRRHRVSTKMRDKSAASLHAANLVRNWELEAAGVQTYQGDRAVKLAEWIDQYERELARRGRAPRYVKAAAMQVRHMVGQAATPADVTPERIRKVLQKLRTEGKKTPRTVNAYRSALRSFFVWLIQEEKWGSNPVDAVRTVQETEKSRERRALTEAELQALLKAAPAHRSAVYLMAARTGLRRGELAALRWSDVDLKEGTVRTRASTSKNRKEAVLPLTQSVQEALRGLLVAVDPSASVFQAIPGVGTLRGDLKAAGVPYETPTGVIDFHALRVSFCTMLGRSGVPLVKAQKLCRHSTPVLTANVYTKLDLDDARQAVDSLEAGVGS